MKTDLQVRPWTLDALACLMCHAISPHPPQLEPDNPQPPGEGPGGDLPAEVIASPQDVWAAVLFIGHVIVIAWLAFGPGLRTALKNEEAG